jgi:hypothetical protein
LHMDVHASRLTVNKCAHVDEFQVSLM